MLYAALRARDGSVWWGVAAGAALGLMVSDRPLIGLVLGTVFTMGMWVPAAFGDDPRGRAWFLRRAGATLLGGAPFAVFLGWFNLRLYGSPFTLGYIAAFGDRHRLGFHMDPWGYPYGLWEAIAFTSSDVLSLGIQLLETPFPVTAIIGLYLLSASRLPRGVGVLAAWAFLPVMANGYYWFHDVRMLYEAAPAWIALGVISVLGLAGGLGSSVEGSAADAGAPGGGRSDRQYPRDWRGWTADVTTWAVLICVVYSVVSGAPGRWRSYRWTEETLQRITAPSPSHRSTRDRLRTRLLERAPQFSPSRRRWDETGQRHHGAPPEYELCAPFVRPCSGRSGSAGPVLDRWMGWILVAGSPPAVDLEQVPGTPLDIERPPSPPGATLRTRAGESFGIACSREVGADRYGAAALAPLLWQGDLPGVEEGRPMFVRDFGPERNQRLLDAHPDRQPFVFVPKDPRLPPEIGPYDGAMAQLWGVVGMAGTP